MMSNEIEGKTKDESCLKHLILVVMDTKKMTKVYPLVINLYCFTWFTIGATVEVTSLNPFGPMA